MTLKALIPVPALVMMAAALMLPAPAAYAAPMTFTAILSGANEVQSLRSVSPGDGPRNDSAGSDGPNTADQRNV